MAEELEKKPVDTRVKLQKLRDFTVQIRHAETDAIVGTGIAISMEGEIVTCRHVFEAAVVAPSDDFTKAEVGVYFPQAKGEKKDRRAKLDRYFSDSDDDAVVLQVIDGSPLAPEQIAILSDAERSEGNLFRSFGYRRLDNFISGRADGKIMGIVDSPQGATLLGEPIQLDSKHINRGMSGAAVLDEKRNLVIGVISDTYFADQTGKDRDTGWAVDANVLTFDPLKVPLYDGEFLELKESAKPSDEVMAQAKASIGQNLSLTEHPAPNPIDEWVGRVDLLEQLDQDWNDPNTKIIGLIGFGGEGKSSLAGKWIADLLNNPDQKQPDGLFWWSFYDRRSVDEFFEAALTYLSIKDEKLLASHKSPSARAHLISGMLYGGKYLFVLDGLEVMQKQEGDDFGEFQSDDLRTFLEYFSAPSHSSFCLITSRAPVFDLMDPTTFKHHDINRLSDNEGCDLLRKVGVTGAEPDLKKAVKEWDGHALTLSLIGGYLVKAHKGDIARIGDIEPPTADEPRFERVHRILRRYAEHLNDDERAFLQLFSAFRTPVEEEAFEKVFRTKISKKALNAPIAALSDKDFIALLDRLQTYRMLRYDKLEKHYTTHPLIRNHYFALLSKRDISQTQNAHNQIKDYYLSVAGDTPHHPTLDDLIPLIEVVHHACQAGAYDEAFIIFVERISLHNRFVIVHELGASETTLALMVEFFSDGDISQQPQVSDPKNKSWILNTVGFCLMNLGRLREVGPFYERMVKGYLAEEDWGGASGGYQNLSELYFFLGRLADSERAAVKALQLARRVEEKFNESQSMSHQALAAHLIGDSDVACKIFKEAETVEIKRQLDNTRYLYSNRGIFHSDHLRLMGKADYAQRITEANMVICKKAHWVEDISMCHRVLGDLASDAGDHPQAGQHYETSLKIARSITKQDVQIGVLLARGRWQAKRATQAPDQADLQQAFSDLNEALDYATKSGYRIYEADIRVALAWAHKASKQPEKARQEAKRALTMSEDMGYYWGKKDAKEVLEAI
ncbi:MAG: serine protease [candidate division Zixibacteria bacterium]|nr:serine protease [candidate division Zixibacteria bacterium]